MEIKTLLKAGLKKHMGSLTGIFVLTFVAAAALATVLTVWTNSNRYIRSEMERAGFGEITAWISGAEDTARLAENMEAPSEIERVEVQSLIYSDYMVNGQESDSEGQLITYIPQEHRYRFFMDNFSAYSDEPKEILQGEVYVSPSMISMFGVNIGDEITFPIARAGKNLILTVKGFYEDPFMGSSMIGMKGFLISEADRAAVLSILQNAGINALARDGAMLHIFPDVNFPTVKSALTASELNSLLNEQTSLAEYTEDVHSKEAVAGFMLVLENAFCGLLIAFVVVLLFVTMVVLSHNISAGIAADYVNMGILKTIGLTAGKLRLIELLKYFISILSGLIVGFIAAIFLSRVISDATLTTTGVFIPTTPPILCNLAAFAALLLLLGGFILLKTEKIRKISPMKAIRGEVNSKNDRIIKIPAAFGKWIQLRLAFRQLVSQRKQYIGVLTTAVLLVFFASLVSRMNTWLGSDGKGMMDAFNPADHDIGVQSFGELTQEEFENTIRSYTDITDTYMLAMPSVVVNGVDYTANVIDQPERFHILEGHTAAADNEIVLTEFVAAHFGVSIGDTVTVQGDAGSEEYVVSGIYSCANDMGDNIGMSREGYLKIGMNHPNLWCWHYFLADTSQKTEIARALESAYGGDIHVHENTWPGLSGIISAMHILLVFMYGMVLVFILIVTVMTGSKILSMEQKDLGIYKAIGFQTNHLRLTFALRFGIVSVTGSLIGTVAAGFFTDFLVSMIMKLAGISNFTSALSVGNTVLPVGIVVLLFTGFAYLAAGKIKKTTMTVLVSAE